ncbi:MAG: hypothetical protein KBC47_01935 [Candidatus Peribacteraceae bacterium]|nr:hypothetical protein [Candidatus Peribacteraceae bacterium]
MLDELVSCVEHTQSIQALCDTYGIDSIALSVRENLLIAVMDGVPASGQNTPAPCFLISTNLEEDLDDTMHGLRDQLERFLTDIVGVEFLTKDGAVDLTPLRQLDPAGKESVRFRVPESMTS